MCAFNLCSPLKEAAAAAAAGVPGSICPHPQNIYYLFFFESTKVFLCVTGGAISGWILKVQSLFSSLHTSGHPVTADLFKERRRSLRDSYCSPASLLVSLLGSVTTAALQPWQLTAIIVPMLPPR